MDGWTRNGYDTWMDGWMDGWMDEWMRDCMHRLMREEQKPALSSWMIVCMDPYEKNKKSYDGYIDVMMDGWILSRKGPLETYQANP